MRDGLYDRYDVEISKFLESEYAEIVPEKEICNDKQRIWYLPHHFVIKPNKPGKLRELFHCAAKYGGK